ncbi:Ribonucleases P/MRP protein subunit-like protein [Hapsidospora chrysogenum ATCC 11550]|uniref:Ribonuclease P/MRP protein subunit POP5 n=1 Tax=Hapsidospora chrysogenum (strain ATCC 11550 / CBS 779.69 / DSM 880 / IAM 14645 / JCM 23072 / IMI 49137) TaxID=857340 RepID=A0A086T235_HAPC1|nr:Ribonucleases P/MRP protein subunit-like protein [Hapsidospora chrysogenum ATCC 11550]
MVRIKERYLLVNIVYPPDPSKPAESSLPSHVVHHQPTTDKLTYQSLLKAIKTEVALLFGDYGSGSLDASLSIKYLSLATSTFIIRCPRAHYRMLWAALTFLHHVPIAHGSGRPCIFRVVRVSGTMRKAEEEAIRRAKRLIIAAQEEASCATSTLTDAHVLQEPLPTDITDESSDESMGEGDG